MLNVFSDEHIVYNLSAIRETVSHAQQSARFKPAKWNKITVQ